MSYRIRRIIKELEQGCPPTDKGYLFVSGSFFTSPVWYRQNKWTEEWEWTVDLVYWNPVDTTIIQRGLSHGERVSEDNIFLINYLKMTYYKKILDKTMRETCFDHLRGVSNEVDSLIEQYERILKDHPSRTRGEKADLVSKLDGLRTHIYQSAVREYQHREERIIEELEVNAGDDQRHWFQIIIGTIRNWRAKMNDNISKTKMIDNARVHLIDEKNRTFALLQEAQARNIALENTIRANLRQIDILSKQAYQKQREQLGEDDYELI